MIINVYKISSSKKDNYIIKEYLNLIKQKESKNNFVK